MNLPPKATLGDLAGLGQLEGAAVRILEDVGSFLPAGTIGVVYSVHGCKASVEYVREDLHEGHPFRIVHVESPFYTLELIR